MTEPSGLILPPNASAKTAGLHDWGSMSRPAKIEFLAERCQAMEAQLVRQKAELYALKAHVPHVVAGLIRALAEIHCGGVLPTFPADPYARRIVFEAWLVGLIREEQIATNGIVADMAKDRQGRPPTQDEAHAEWRASLALRILTGFTAPGAARTATQATVTRQPADKLPDGPATVAEKLRAAQAGHPILKFPDPPAVLPPVGEVIMVDRGGQIQACRVLEHTTIPEGGEALLIVPHDGGGGQETVIPADEEGATWRRFGAPDLPGENLLGEEEA